MRLVLRDVEVADAQREIDGIEVFEGRRQDGSVGRQEDNCQRRNCVAQE
jgi:hypothetical protein